MLFPIGRADPADQIAIRAWLMMDGRIDWSALDTVCALFGVDDPEVFIHQLIAIRDHVRAQSG